MRTRSSSQNLTTTLFNISNTNTKNTKNKTKTDHGPKEEDNQQPIITLTCADTYTTLSRHPGYARATSDMARWLPTLHAIPIPIPTPKPKPKPALAQPTPSSNPRANTNDKTAGKAEAAASAGLQAHAASTNGVVVAHAMRPALEIDAANVMAVLRDFDRRFAA